jgi:hypothetical protein
MAGSSNFVQWNPTTSPNTGNQQNDSAFATTAANGAAVNAIFPSNVANKLFYQLSTFVSALAGALAAQGLNLSDASISTLQSVLTSIVVSGVGSSPTLGDVTCNSLNTSSLLSTTGLASGGGIVSGKAAPPTAGSYAIYDSTGALLSGVAPGTKILLSTAVSSGYHVCGGLIVP